MQKFYNLSKVHSKFLDTGHELLGQNLSSNFLFELELLHQIAQILPISSLDLYADLIILKPVNSAIPLLILMHFCIRKNDNIFGSVKFWISQ